jgi:hypothetical protein
LSKHFESSITVLVIRSHYRGYNYTITCIKMQQLFWLRGKTISIKNKIYGEYCERVKILNYYKQMLVLEIGGYLINIIGQFLIRGVI